jgi:hypothetical protein
LHLLLSLLLFGGSAGHQSRRKDDNFNVALDAAEKVVLYQGTASAVPQVSCFVLRL